MFQNQSVQGYRELLTLMSALATSQHVSAEVINAAGTGYVVGEIITLTHAGAFADATFEVLTIGGGGSVTSLKRRNWGAFSNRVATVAVNAGGTGYAVGDILEIQGGTETQMAKAQVDTEAAGVITGVSVFETGGAYTVAPGLTGAATLGIGPSTFAGDDAATLDLTMTGLIGTTALATTASAAGTGLTLDITLTATGWSTGSQNGMRDTNDLSVNSINDEKQLALKGTVTGGDEPFVLFRTGTTPSGPDTNYWITWAASDAYNPAVDFQSQAGLLGDTLATLNSAHYTPMFDAKTQDCWISISQRKFLAAIKTPGLVTLSYQFGYTGLGNPFATAVNNPYPLVVGASGLGQSNDFPDSNQITGPVEAFTDTTSVFFVRRHESGGFVGCLNRFPGPTGTAFRTRGIYPGMENDNLNNINDASTISFDGRIQMYDLIRPDGLAPVVLMLPTPDSGGDLFVPIPLVCMEASSTQEPVATIDKLRVELENMFWVTGVDSTGTDINAEDTITDVNGDRYRVIRGGQSTREYSLWCLKEE